MDTLCIPLGEKIGEFIPLTDEKKRGEYRSKSIANMRNIYRSAASVLVLDTGMQGLSLSSSLPEKIMRIYLSSWVHRLWTFQEGILAKELYIQFDRGAESVDEINEKCLKHGKDTMDSGFYLKFPSVAQESVLSHRFMKEIHDSESARYGQLERISPDNCLRFAHVTRAMEQRATSKRADETICAASVMGLSVEKLLQIKDADADRKADKRMEEFLKQVWELPKGIIFHHNERLRRVGVRWAPRTLMGGRPGDFFRDMPTGVSQFDGTCLRVEYPGILLGPVKKSYGKELVVFTINNVGFQCYWVEIFQEKDQEPLTWLLDSYYAITMRPFEEGLDYTDAILGIVDYQNIDEALKSCPLQHKCRLPSGITLYFQVRCSVRQLSDVGGVKPEMYLNGRMLENSQKWFIR